MSSREEILSEFQRELDATRRMIDRVPADKLAWKPHEKSLSIGQLALHMALIPGAIASITSQDTFDVQSAKFIPPQPKEKREIETALEESVANVEKIFAATSDASAQGPWRLVRGDQELATMPRCEGWRSLMLNHWYHHRGQMSVYLRLLDVPVPSVYGPSADESPFG